MVTSRSGHQRLSGKHPTLLKPWEGPLSLWAPCDLGAGMVVVFVPHSAEHPACPSAFGVQLALSCLSPPWPLGISFWGPGPGRGSAREQYLGRPAVVSRGMWRVKPLWGVRGLTFLRASACGQVGVGMKVVHALAHCVPPPLSWGAWLGLGNPRLLCGRPEFWPLPAD